MTYTSKKKKKERKKKVGVGGEARGWHDVGLHDPHLHIIFLEMISRPAVFVSIVIELHIAINWPQQLKVSSTPISGFQFQ